MSVYSLLPESWAGVELWVARFFILLGILVIGPWLFLVLYDIALYGLRAALFHIPFIGGRAHGRRERPRAPSLRERPDGEPRVMFPLVAGHAGVEESGEGEGTGSEDKALDAQADGGLRERGRRTERDGLL